MAIQRYASGDTVRTRESVVRVDVIFDAARDGKQRVCEVEFWARGNLGLPDVVQAFATDAAGQMRVELRRAGQVS